MVGQDGGVSLAKWEPDLAWYAPTSWVAMVLPLFFVDSGFAHATSLAEGERRDYAAFLLDRCRRLLGPLLSLLASLTLVATLIALLPGLPAGLPLPIEASRLGMLEVAQALSHGYAAILWFAAVYLALAALAPLAVALHDRAPLLPLGLLLLGVALVDAWARAANDLTPRNLNLLLVYGFAHQLGIAYQRGWFRRGPLAWPLLALATGAVGIVALIKVAGYPPLALAFWDASTGNSTPPTVALALLALAQVAVLAMLERAGVLRRLPAWAERGLAIANAVLVTAYLWHLWLILLAFAIAAALALAFPLLAALALQQLTTTLLALALVAALAPWIARLDARLSPAAAALDPRLAVIAFGMLLSGVVLIWQFGALLNPAYPWSGLGLALVAAAAALLGPIPSWLRIHAR